jgi:hypothetical protein
MKSRVRTPLYHSSFGTCLEMRAVALTKEHSTA